MTSQSPASLIESIDKVRKKVRDTTATQIRSKSLKTEIRGIAESYFNLTRSSFTSLGRETDIEELDSTFKGLIELSHKSGAKSTYTRRLNSAKRQLVSLDADLAAQAPFDESSALYDSVDKAIVDTLQSILPSASASYRQALQDLESTSRLSYRGPATDLRESLRETLDHLAPDRDVKAMDGYKQDPNVSGPTMKQKVQYILRLRDRPSAQIGSAVATVSLIDEMIGKFVRSVYTRSSVSTHTPTNRDEVLRLRQYVRLALIEILEIRE